MNGGAAPHGHWLVLGGDIGGTRTRMIVADRTGRVHGRGVAGGGNPVSHPATAATAFGEALGRALDGIEASRVRGAVIGLAGGTALRDPVMREQFDRAWFRAGLTCGPSYASDLEVAFASGTAEPHGAVLIAGTGAVAGAIRDHRLVQTVDGHGWLLGDDGSGFWIGREAARATLRALDDLEPALGKLARLVLRSLDIQDDRADAKALRSQLIRTVYSRAPVRLAELAPLVTAAHTAGDPVAEEIVDEAARRLAWTLTRLGRGSQSGPIVLAGSLVRPESPVGARLRSLIAGRFPEAPVTAHDGVAGAAWLAIAAADPRAATPEVLTRLVNLAPRASA